MVPPVPSGCVPVVARPEDRKLGHVVARRAEPEVDPPLLRYRLEQVPSSGGRLGGAEEQVPAFPKRKMEQPEQLRLDLGLEVDQQVAAADHVEAGERRVLHQVLGRPGDRVAQRPLDLIAVVLPVEEALQALLTDVLGDARRVQAARAAGSRCSLTSVAKILRSKNFCAASARSTTSMAIE